MERALFIADVVDSLEEARSEVDRLESVYERRREVYERMAAWRTHWAVRITFYREAGRVLDAPGYKWDGGGGSV